MDSKESIPPAYVAGGPLRQPYSYSVPSPKVAIKFQHRNRFIAIDSASQYGLAGRYDNPIPSPHR